MIGRLTAWAAAFIGVWAPQGRCEEPPIPSVVEENARLGSPPTRWDVEGAGDPSIQGFATDISVNRGETVGFKVRALASGYRVEIYRIGYYSGAGARLTGVIDETAVTRAVQPDCLRQAATGLVDCDNWLVTARWAVPGNARSGVYIARLVRSDTGGASHIPFVVRDDDGASDILLQTSDTTWQAYNEFGGVSLYTGGPAGRAYKVSYNRPMTLRGSRYGRSSFWASEYPTIRWLEANGYDVSYATGVDTDRRGRLLKRHKVFMSVGHDEYWSRDQRANVEAARDAGVHLAFLSGNAVFWKARWEPSIGGSGTAHRSLVVYKETLAGEKIDPSPLSTGTWRDPRFSPPEDGGRPENALKGNLFVANCCRFDPVVVSDEQGRTRFWRHTELGRLEPGQSAAVGAKTVGYEWDGDVENGFRPEGLVRLSATGLTIDSALQDFGSSYGKGPATHNVTLYKHRSGALVFSAGTVNWGWALDARHADPDHQDAPTDPRLQQATMNMLADMSVQPGSPQAPLIPSPASQDVTPPLAVITRPAAREEFTFFLPVTVEGSATDQGGVPAAVEVSLDGGATWRPTERARSWSVTFTPKTRGGYSILARAVDDSGNRQETPTSVTIKVSGLAKFARPLAIGGGAAVLSAAFLLLYYRRQGLRARGSRPLG